MRLALGRVTHILRIFKLHFLENEALKEKTLFFLFGSFLCVDFLSFISENDKRKKFQIFDIIVATSMEYKELISYKLSIHKSRIQY